MLSSDEYIRLINPDKIKYDEEIGSGVFGRVQKARLLSGTWPQKSVTIVAIKILAKSDAFELINEALLMKKFDHPNILPLEGISFQLGKPVLIMPFMSNGDLLSYMKKSNKSLTIENKLSISRDIASGMEYLSSMNVVHRDLAARNIMLDCDKNVKISDFGLSRDVSEKNYYRLIKHYMLPFRWLPPECLIEPYIFNERTDVWSFGITVWEILSNGQVPFEKFARPEKLIASLKMGFKLSRPGNCPAKLYSIMLKTWQIKNELRPSFSALKCELEDIILNYDSSNHVSVNEENYEGPFDSKYEEENSFNCVFDQWDQQSDSYSHPSGSDENENLSYVDISSIMLNPMMRKYAKRSLSEQGERFKKRNLLILFFCTYIAMILFVLIYSFYTGINIHAQNTNEKRNVVSLINKTSKISDFVEKQWFLENIPFIDIPDKDIERVYYYRWTTLKRHLRYLSIDDGYVVTDYLNDVNYCPKLSRSISGASGHHIYEIRWIRDQRYIKDYIKYLTKRRNYKKLENNEWITEAAYQAFLLNGDKQFITAQLEYFKKLYRRWGNHFDSKLGLYYSSPLEDSLDYTVASFQNNDTLIGGWGYRPSHNSQMYGNAVAIKIMSKLIGDDEVEEFEGYASSLRESILKYLWDDNRKFFYHRHIKHNSNETYLLDTREVVGFYPWRFRVPDDTKNFSLALNQLFDPEGFGTEFGPPTCETRSQWFDKNHQSSNDKCTAQGHSWPFSTSHVLSSVATHLRNYNHQNPNISAEDYVSLLRKFALTQYKQSKPYVAECHSHFKKVWVGDISNRSEHHAYSTFVDNVLNELLGIRPSDHDTLIIDPVIPKNWTYFAVEDIPYHGHRISVVYDKTGLNYELGKGVIVFVDGLKWDHRNNFEEIQLKISLNDTGASNNKMVNYAVSKKNYSGQNFATHPRPYASFTDSNSWVYFAVDGRIIYDKTLKNWWSNLNSNNSQDWFAIDFGKYRMVNYVNVYVYSDVATNGGRIDCPKTMVVQYMNETNNWINVKNQTHWPEKCAGNDKNRINFSPLNTTQLRVVFSRNTVNDYYVGIIEIEAWAQIIAPRLAKNTGKNIDFKYNIECCFDSYKDKEKRSSDNRNNKSLCPAHYEQRILKFNLKI